jgi:hypothetical protein
MAAPVSMDLPFAAGSRGVWTFTTLRRAAPRRAARAFARASCTLLALRAACLMSKFAFRLVPLCRVPVPRNRLQGCSRHRVAALNPDISPARTSLASDVTICLGHGKAKVEVGAPEFQQEYRYAASGAGELPRIGLRLPPLAHSDPAKWSTAPAKLSASQFPPLAIQGAWHQHHVRGVAPQNRIRS